MVDPRERVEAALSLEVSDRPPVGAWGHDYIAEWSPKDLAESTISAHGRYGWDFVKVQPRASCFSEAFGAEWRPSGNRLGGPVLVSLPEELDFRPQPLEEQVEAIALVAEKLSDIPVIQTVFSPLTVAGYLFGDDLDRGRPHLDRIADALIDFSRKSVEAGAAGVFFAISGYASSDRVPLIDYEEAFLAGDLKVVEAIAGRGWFNVLHLCGPRIHFDLARRFPVQAVSWSVQDEGNPSLSEGVERSGRAAMGGIGQRTTLLHGTAEEITAETRRAASANEGRGVLVAPGCSVPPEVSEESLRAIHL